MPRLTERHRRFCQEYVRLGNACEAAVNAGFKHREYGRQLLTLSYVEAEIQKIREKANARAEFNLDMALRENAYLAQADLRKICAPGEDFSFIPPHELPDDIAPAIASVKKKLRTFKDRDGNVEEVVTWEYKLWDKGSALDRSFRIFGAYKDSLKVDLEGDVNINAAELLLDRINSIASRVETPGSDPGPKK